MHDGAPHYWAKPFVSQLASFVLVDASMKKTGVKKAKLRVNAEKVRKLTQDAKLPDDKLQQVGGAGSGLIVCNSVCCVGQ